MSGWRRLGVTLAVPIAAAWGWLVLRTVNHWLWLGSMPVAVLAASALWVGIPLLLWLVVAWVARGFQRPASKS